MHQFIQIVQRGIYMWRYTYTANVFVNNACCMYFVFSKKGTVQFAGCHPVNGYATYGATVFGFERGVQFNFRNTLNFTCPVVFKVTDTFLLPFIANSQLKVNGLAYPLLYR